MHEIGPAGLPNGRQSDNEEAFIDRLLSDIPEYSPYFECVKRVNVGQKWVPAEELGEFELGPNSCTGA